MFDTVKAYAAGAVALLVLGLALFAGWQYDHARAVEKQMQEVQEDMHNTRVALTQLQAGVDASNLAITGMAASMAQVTQHGGVVRARVQTLRGADNAIRTYLDTPLPPNGCLLDDTCPGGGASAETFAGAASAVRPAGNGAVTH